MKDGWEFRASQLAMYSEHFRDLALGMPPGKISAEIAALADQFAEEAQQLIRENTGAEALELAPVNKPKAA